jgi:hypothetical protein
MKMRTYFNTSDRGRKDESCRYGVSSGRHMNIAIEDSRRIVRKRTPQMIKLTDKGGFLHGCRYDVCRKAITL